MTVEEELERHVAPHRPGRLVMECFGDTDKKDLVDEGDRIEDHHGLGDAPIATVPPEDARIRERQRLTP